MPKKKHKKRYIILAVVLLIVISVGVSVSSFIRRSRQMIVDMMNQVDTAVVETRTLVSSISATGTIGSVQSKEVTAAVSGVEVTALYVEVGDRVRTGDLLCEFDTSDLEKRIADAEASLDNTLARSNIDLENAQRSLKEAQETRDIQNARNEQAVINAWNDYEAQSEKVSALYGELNDLKKTLDAKEKEIAAIEKELEAASKGTVSGGDGSGSAKKPEAMEQLEAQLQSLKAQLSSIQSSVTAKDNELTQARNTQDSLLSAYVRSAETQEDGIRNNDSSVLSREASLESTRLNNATVGESERQQIENYQEQIEACTVAAPMSGVVTSVNLEVGDNYNGNIILTIEDDSSYIIETQIDEYDIGKIKAGQEVVIRTNATGQEELPGTVIHVAPRASNAQGQGSGSVTYTVKISMDTPHDMIRMDMTAKLSIILEKKENVLTVPYDAVREDEDGNSYVEVVADVQPISDGQWPDENSSSGQQPDGFPLENSAMRGRGQMPDSADSTMSYVRIYVTKGIESDYYVEVSGEGLAEGMQVVVPKTGDSSTDIFNRLMQRGPMGGF